MDVTLNDIEVRVLGCLIEKQATTPESYPPTLNALVLACNQKTSRAPLMEVADADVQATLDDLRALGVEIADHVRAEPRERRRAA